MVASQIMLRTNLQRGDIFYADLSGVKGSEQGGVRPVVIVQNNVGNRYSPTVIVAAITSKTDKSKLPTHVNLLREECGLQKDSVVLLEQIRTVDKSRLLTYIGHLDEEQIKKLDVALAVSFAMCCTPVAI